MRMFVKKVALACCLLFFCLVLPAVAFLGYRYRQLVEKGNEIFAIEQNEQIIALGDSHCSCSFTIGKKLSFSASPINVSLMRLKEFEKRGGLENIKVCLITFCYTTFSEMTYTQQIRGIWHFMPFSLQYMDDAPIGKMDLSSELLEFTIANLAQTPAIADVFQGGRLKARVGATYTPLDERSPEWIEKAMKATADAHFSWESNPSSVIPDMDGFLLKVVCEIKEVCDRNNIRLIIVSTPLAESYRALVPKWAKDRMADWMATFHNLGIEYHDYSNFGHDHLFADGEHLNMLGAEEFSKKIMLEVIELLNVH